MPGLPVAEDCKRKASTIGLRGRPMQSRETAYALSVRTGRLGGQSNREVLLEQRPASLSVMRAVGAAHADRSRCPRGGAAPDGAPRHHAGELLRADSHVFEDDIGALTVRGGQRRWVRLAEAAGMALTGLAARCSPAPSAPRSAAGLHCPAGGERQIRGLIAGGSIRWHPIASKEALIQPVLYRGMTLQAAEKLLSEPPQAQGTTSQAAEKLLSGGRPGIYPGIRPMESTRALAPEGMPNV